ncbi:T9SS type A sorting domain-containing protein [candidate division TA06 bacterium]|uniref:T9SS type A sorting domain-containing protein n=1 Tax=candidate division TA06 bacterium TaxID=2250710 RepID=A0A933I9K4_UNCT6|nr:T9SS type A sorting domain-containing protein [candidate division TA06 bacterium]
MRKLFFLLGWFSFVTAAWGSQIPEAANLENKPANPWTAYLNNSVDSVKQIFFANQDTDKLLLQSPSNDGYVNFNLAQGLHQNPAGARYNPTAYLGWNVMNGGAREIAGEAQVFDSWEHRFVPQVGKTLLERHWIFGGETGNSYRPISSSMQVENELVDLSFCADEINFFDKTSTFQYFILRAIGSIIINNKSIEHTMNDDRAYYINQTLPATKDIQVIYAMGGANIWSQRIMAGSYDYSIYNITRGHDLYIRNADGFVGIGTTTPLARLDVNGGVRAKTLQIGDSTVYITKQKFIRRDTLFEVVNSDTFYMLKKGAVSAVSEDTVLPDKESYNALMQNYPNPVSNIARIEYRLAKNGHVKLDIYNTLGQKVRTLIDRNMPPGAHVSVWDGKDDEDRKVSAGIYIYKLEADDFNAVQKMILIR